MVTAGTLHLSASCRSNLRITSQRQPASLFHRPKNSVQIQSPSSDTPPHSPIGHGIVKFAEDGFEYFVSTITALPAPPRLSPGQTAHP